MLKGVDPFNADQRIQAASAIRGQSTGRVPCASIVWLARAVNVVRPAARRLHIDRAHFAKGGRLGITLAVCISGLNLSAKPRLFSRGKSGIMF